MNSLGYGTKRVMTELAPSFEPSVKQSALSERSYTTFELQRRGKNRFRVFQSTNSISKDIQKLPNISTQVGLEILLVYDKVAFTSLMM
jgi:hypothetical protein